MVNIKHITYGGIIMRSIGHRIILSSVLLVVVSLAVLGSIASFLTYKSAKESAKTNITQMAQMASGNATA